MRTIYISTVQNQLYMCDWSPFVRFPNETLNAFFNVTIMIDYGQLKIVLNFLGLVNTTTFKITVQFTKLQSNCLSKCFVLYFFFVFANVYQPNKIAN